MTEQEQEAALINFDGDAKQRGVLRWLVGTPATDGNFKSALDDADDATVRETLRIIEGDDGTATKRKALESRLKKILAGLIAVNDRQSRTLTMEVATLEEERIIEKQLTAEQAEREKKVAETYRLIGRIQGAKLVADFGNVAGFMWCQEVQKQKLYKDMPGVRTWEKFCESTGIARKKIEDGINNLEILGENFLATVAGFRVGSRDLRKLRQLTLSGEVVIDAEAMIIGGERIPLNSDHSDELQAAIEKIIEEKDFIRQRVDKLEKDVAGVVKEETRGLKAERDLLIKEVRRLKPFDPEEKDRSWTGEQMKEIRGHCDAFSTAIYKFVLDPRLKGDHQLIAEINAHILASENELRDLRERFETDYEVYGG